ncbi:PQ loop repeat protein [Pleurotus pulmonarius]
MSNACTPHHDWFTATLTAGLCVGLIISYAPQHFRIINKQSSEGLSPWFLLLGSTSGASGFLNMVALQWGIVKCCRYVSAGSCAEITLGVVQVGLQWFLFTMIMVLYMIYYPPNLKYIAMNEHEDYHDTRPSSSLTKQPIKREEWSLSIILSWVVVVHLILISFITFFFLLTATPSPSPSLPLPKQVHSWATFLGVSSALLAAIQYAPQIAHTYRHKVVGALSIPMMCIQTPGAILMVTSIALRPGTNWTSWITFAVAGVMQGTLLVMCIFWKIRQQRLGIDDFGHSLASASASTIGGSTYVSDSRGEEEVPGLVTGEGDDPTAVSMALAAALESAAETDLRAQSDDRIDAAQAEDSERTPLLGNPAKDGEAGGRATSDGWFGWLRRLSFLTIALITMIRPLLAVFELPPGRAGP